MNLLKEWKEVRAFIISLVPVIGALLALLAVVGAVMAGLGTRWEVWHFRVGLGLLKWSAYAGICSLILSAGGIAAGLISTGRRALALSIAGCIISGLVVGIPAYWARQARQLPAIHDITTDTVNPPQFVAILPLRMNASNPPGYGGPQIAEQQEVAYPQVRPLIYPDSFDMTYDKVFVLARRLGWKIVDASRKDGRIEAVDSTLWFGFKDDIVIRIRPLSSGTRIDIRSVSRVGVSDIGTNARRITRFLQAMGK